MTAGGVVPAAGVGPGGFPPSAPISGFGPTGFPPATPPSSSGRGARLSNAAPVGLAPVAAGRESDVAPAGLAPRSETPRNAVPLPDGVGGPLVPAPADKPVGDVGGGETGGSEPAAGEAVGEEIGAGDTGGIDPPRGSIGLEVLAGEETGWAGDAALAPAAGTAGPVGTQPDVADEGGGGVE
jgi:hypothetical protein